MNKKPTFEEYGYTLGSFSPIFDTGNISKHMRGMSLGNKPAYVVKAQKSSFSGRSYYETDKSRSAQKENKRRLRVAKQVYENYLVKGTPFFTHNRDLEVEIKSIGWTRKKVYYGV